MSTHVNATALEETPHETETTQITISDAVEFLLMPSNHKQFSFKKPKARIEYEPSVRLTQTAKKGRCGQIRPQLT